MFKLAILVGTLTFCQFWDQGGPIEHMDYFMSKTDYLYKVLVNTYENKGEVPKDVAEEFAQLVVYCYSEKVIDLATFTDDVCKDKDKSTEQSIDEVTAQVVKVVNKCAKDIADEAAREKK